ncbi:MAG: beta strand repeat-containing protein [Sulfurimonas sp.]|uniref:beta strand repeat-containing protein n=1 Tax=Sulfurimonas sp. TaxID=2022749 RepID=UPI003D0CCE6F
MFTFHCQTGTLTTGATPDTIIGTANNDLITGTTAQLSVDDRIMDSSTSDNDTFNLTATTDPVAMDVTNVENINIDWDAFGTPDIDLTNVTGATVTLSSDKSGYLGHANFDNVDRNNIVVGDGVTGDVTVDTTVDSTIDAGNAKTLTVTAADRDLTVNANNSETVTIAAANDVDNLTVSATNATALTVDANRAADVTVGKNADLTMTGTADYTIQSTADVQLDVAAGAAFDTLAIAGDNAVTLSFANAADIAGQTITNAGVIRVEDELAATVDYTDIEATSIVLEALQTANATEITTVNGANFVLELGNGVADTVTFAVTTADDSSADEITVELQDDTAAALDFNEAADEDFETVNIIANATVSATAVDLTIASILAGTNKVVLSAAENDVTVTVATAGEVDASEVTGNFVITQNNTDTDMLIIGGKAKNTVDFDGAVTAESTFVGNATSDAIDNITFDTTTGDAVAMVYGGNNIVDAAAITDGQLTVVAGSGNDTVTATGTSLKHGTLSLQLGDGNNSVTFDMDGARTTGMTASITTGTGNDSIEITAATEAEDDITIDLGTGTNTLTITSVDLSLGTQSITGVDVIAIGSSDTAAVVNATLLDGSSITLTGDSTTTDHLAVAITGSDTTVDFSGMTIDNTIDKAIGGLEITAKAGVANNITATHGDDNIIGNTGVDTINFAATAALNGEDTITTFTAGTDKLNISAFASVTEATTVTGNITATAGNVYFFSADITAGGGDVAVAANVATALNAAAVWADTTVTSYIVIVDTDAADDGAGTGSAIYSWTDAGSNEVAAAELTLMGTVDAVLTTADLVFA